ncbi:retinol dehydrogenase 13-like [Plodia interpunctella]|uniref:retinol dehydrogenase 13-like n=1 Tax=Plodia interpunctella TaxID=58824 RepID=UPI002367D152|nr:retinol dehydrogenase 13-like [Plodia interpunctella]
MALLLIIYSVITTISVLILIIGLYQKNTNTICQSKRRLDGKTVLVTGGTSGMGLEVATDFARRGARVIVACPFQEEGISGKESIIWNSGNKNVVFEHLDLSKYDSVKKFAANIIENETRLDILVNNAGVSISKITKDGFNMIMQVNYLGTILLTFLLLPLLEKSGDEEEPSRIINTASVSHNVGKVDFDSWKTKTGIPFQYYANSKLCLSLFTRELSKRLKGSKVVVNAIDPGVVGTRIYKIGTNYILGSLVVFFATYFSKDPWEGAQTAIHASVCEKARKISGEYFFNCKVTKKTKLPWFNDIKVNKALWDNTLEAIDQKLPIN